jgi:Ca2+-transporting ATPase
MTITRVWHFGETNPIDVAQKHKISELDHATKTILRVGNVVNHGRLQTGENASSSLISILSSTAGDDPAHAKSRWVGQPTDVALLDLLDSFGEDDVRNRIGSRKYETPFSSERKWMGVVINGSESSSGSDVAYIKGALEQVLKKCDTYLMADGREIVLDEKRKQEAIAAADAMAVQGLRVLGFASGPVRPLSVQSRSGRSTPASNSRTNGFGFGSPNKAGFGSDEEIYNGLVFAGLVGMNDPPRKGVDRAIRRLMAGGVRVIMVTGDSETTAVAIGRQLGMPIMNSSLGHSVLRGDQVEQMSEADLSQAIATTTIFARTSPEHKLKIVRALQARGDVVAMTGDGVNDAPALKKADIGISMGKMGTDVAKEAADMILTDDDFSTILNAIEEGKGIFYNIQNFLTFQLSTSAAALSLVLLSTIFGFKNPLNAMQILWISTWGDIPFPLVLITNIPTRYPHGWPSCPIAWR